MMDAQLFQLLVVDDNEMNRDMLSRRLQRQGYQVDAVESGENALGALQTTNYDLILLDVMMPGLNGYEVLERVKSDDQLHDIPVIMISALDDLESVVRCIELGAEDYLFKPFNPVLLKARVGASLEKRAMQQARRRDFNPAQHKALIDIQKRLVSFHERERDSLTPEQTSQLTTIILDFGTLLNA